MSVTGCAIDKILNFKLRYYIPASGGPTIPAIPRANVSKPNALDSLCNPSRSHRIIEVSDM